MGRHWNYPYNIKNDINNENNAKDSIKAKHIKFNLNNLSSIMGFLPTELMKFPNNIPAPTAAPPIPTILIPDPMGL